MNKIDKLKTIISTSKPIKDINSKEVYVGDIVLLPTSNTTMIKAMVFSISNTSNRYKVITEKGNVFNSQAECFKITNMLEQSEIDTWNKHIDKYYSDKEAKKSSEIKKGIIPFMFYDKKSRRPGIAFSNVVSNPGQNIKVSNIKTALEWLDLEKDKEFYFFTKDYGFEENPALSNIFIATTNNFYSQYMNFYKPIMKNNTFYYASRWIDNYSIFHSEHLQDASYMRSYIRLEHFSKLFREIYFKEDYTNTMYLPHIMIKHTYNNPYNKGPIFADNLIEKINEFLDYNS